MVEVLLPGIEVLDGVEERSIVAIGRRGNTQDEGVEVQLPQARIMVPGDLLKLRGFLLSVSDLVTLGGLEFLNELETHGWQTVSLSLVREKADDNFEVLLARQEAGDEGPPTSEGGHGLLVMYGDDLGVLGTSVRSCLRVMWRRMQQQAEKRVCLYSKLVRGIAECLPGLLPSPSCPMQAKSDGIHRRYGSYPDANDIHISTEYSEHH